MKKPLIALFGILTSLTLHAQDKPVTVVACVGDSITAGSGAGEGKAYPTQLQTLLGAEWSVKNFGVSARTMLKKGDFPYWNEKAFTQAKESQPNVVVIMLGTNDTKPQNWKNKQDFDNDYKEMIKIFQTLPTKPKVFVCHPCPVPAPGNFGINEEGVKAEIRVIDKLAKETGATVINIHDALEKRPELLPDRVHPNAEGAAIMAATVAAALKGK